MRQYFFKWFESCHPIPLIIPPPESKHLTWRRVLVTLWSNFINAEATVICHTSVKILWSGFIQISSSVYTFSIHLTLGNLLCMIWDSRHKCSYFVKPYPWQYICMFVNTQLDQVIIIMIRLDKLVCVCMSACGWDLPCLLPLSVSAIASAWTDTSFTARTTRTAQHARSLKVILLFKFDSLSSLMVTV